MLYPFLGSVCSNIQHFWGIIYGQLAIGHGNSFASKEDTTVAKPTKRNKTRSAKTVNPEDGVDQGKSSVDADTNPVRMCRTPCQKYSRQSSIAALMVPD